MVAYSAFLCSLLLKWNHPSAQQYCASGQSAVTTPVTTVASSTNIVPRSTSAASSTASIIRTSSTLTTVRTTTTASSSSRSSTFTTTTTTSSISAAATVSVGSTVLIIGRTDEDLRNAAAGFKGYGIPYQTLQVPQAGVALPALTGQGTANFGGIIVVGQVSYDYSGTWRSALTTEQWQQLYDYQTAYGIRMVQYDVYPGAAYGATPVGGGCCARPTDQPIYFSDTSAFAQAGIKTGAQMSTEGLYHYPARVADSATTKEIARFGSNSQFPSDSTAGVLNRFADGREQMVFFIGFAQTWSPTSVWMQHAYISWLTKGLYAGYRRVNLNTQIDDVYLETDLYRPVGGKYRITAADMQDISNWVPQIRNRMNPGSIFYPELAHNGNGNILEAVETAQGRAACGSGPIDPQDRPDPPLEFKKPLGSGTNTWPTTPASYSYSSQCLTYDGLGQWLRSPGNRDRFMHLSHTFTHMNFNNATYSDGLKEIQFNQAWLQATGLSSGLFSSRALVPPAITGLHNGDILRAWTDAGLRNCVGDNTRPLLRNQNNDMHAYITTMAADGYDGFFVIPRWATRIYYNCDTRECDFQEWKDISQGSGSFDDLLRIDRTDAIRHLFGLYHDGFMFHQANLRTQGVQDNLSLYQLWVNAVVAEFTRLVDWPLITLKQDDLAQSFADRAARDACAYKLSWTQSQTNGANGTRPSSITGFTVTANGNRCSASIPITLPKGSSVTNLNGARSEKAGNDAETIWVPLSGSAKIYTFTSAIRL